MSSPLLKQHVAECVRELRHYLTQSAPPDLYVPFIEEHQADMERGIQFFIYFKEALCQMRRGGPLPLGLDVTLQECRLYMKNEGRRVTTAGASCF